jgi:inhibitor of KinA sporulation pathway (predicted exonuclease)
MRYVIVDLEATCWEKGTTPARMEIIEIGAILLASATGPASREFAEFVRPVAEPTLSDFCIQLTSIRQEEVDAAGDFKTVLPRFLDWLGSEPFTLCSWGAYDLNQFKTDCARHDLPLPAAFERHINLKQEFAVLKGVKPCGMKHALRLLGLPLEGQHHRAIDDARNIAKIAQLILPAIRGQE